MINSNVDASPYTRIMFITTGTNTGGAERMLLKMLALLNREKFTIRVISLTTVGPIGREIQNIGIGVKALGIGLPLSTVKAMFKLVREIRSFQPDIVQTWMYHADLIGGIVARLFSQAKVIWGIRQSNLDGKQSKISVILVSKICARLSGLIPDLILCCSRASVSTHVGMGYKKDCMKYLPNGFDSEKFYFDVGARARFRSRHDIPDDCYLIGNLSRFDPQKDLESFLSAVAILLRARSDVRIVMAGSGIDETNAQLVEMIDRENLNDIVLLLGELVDVRELLSALDILTLSSAYGEGFPNVIGEAMLTEVICVVTDVGDSKEIVGECGITVPIRSPDAIYMAWQRIFSMDKKELSSKRNEGRRKIIEKYDLKQVVCSYEKLYLNFLESNPSAG